MYCLLISRTRCYTSRGGPIIQSISSMYSSIYLDILYSSRPFIVDEKARRREKDRERVDYEFMKDHGGRRLG